MYSKNDGNGFTLIVVLISFCVICFLLIYMGSNKKKNGDNNSVINVMYKGEKAKNDLNIIQKQIDNKNKIIQKTISN